MKSTTTRIRPAIYARVSSERQVDEATIDSQLAALRERVAADGLLLDEELVFVDDGYSGTTLMRPALERLRDMSYAGAFDRLYIYCPDRLVRSYAYQVLLVDELKQDAIETVFLNCSIGDTPEGRLLLQMQGMIAEYERAKIIERGRRGRRYTALRGSLNAIGHAPYGYRYISKHQAGGEAYYQVVPQEADLVRELFEWVGRDRLTLCAVSRRLRERGLRSPKGNQHWNRGSICKMLKNPAYQGLAAFGKTRAGDRLPRLRPARNQPEMPRRVHTCRGAPISERISIPVPAIVSPELFAAVQEQLEENRRRSREQKQGAKYLLQGLLVCGCCGSACCGKHAQKGGRYPYYRCLGTDAYRFGGQRMCDNKQLSTAALDATIWSDVEELLRDPDSVRKEYARRMDESMSDDRSASEQLARQINGSRRAISRLLDAYTADLVSKDEFESRMRREKNRLASLEAQATEMAQRQAQRSQLKRASDQFNNFVEQLRNGLEHADWTTRREIIRLLVKAVTISPDDVKISYRISPRALPDRPARGRTRQHCRPSRERGRG